MPPAILVVTGASGAGKTTAIRALEAREMANVGCYYFDSIGVPSTEEMTAEFGSPEGWQIAKTHDWIARLAATAHPSGIAVLDGQVKPGVVREAFDRHRVRRGSILLLDCSTDVRLDRLTLRGQPELATTQMTAWAAYLRGQADALQVPVLDTTGLTPLAVADALAQHVEALLAAV